MKTGSAEGFDPDLTQAPGGGVERQDRLEIVAAALRRGLGSEFFQHMFHENRHVKEADPSGEEGVERRLLRRVIPGHQRPQRGSAVARAERRGCIRR